MKRFLFFFIILILIFTISCYAAAPEFLGDKPNLLYNSNTVSSYIYTDPFDFSGSYCNFKYITLKENTTYTLYSTGGLDRFVLSPRIDGKLYSFNSNNLINISEFNGYGNAYMEYDGETLTFVSDPSVSGSSYFNLCSISVTPGHTYEFSCSDIFGTDSAIVDRNGLMFSNINNFSTSPNYGQLDSRNKTLTITPDSDTIYVYGFVSFQNNLVVKNLSFSDVSGRPQGYTVLPIYSEVFVNNTYTEVYYFTTPRYIMDIYLFGLHGSNYDSDDYLFSVEALDNDVNNNIYLLEGFYSVDTLLSFRGDDFYNSGYDSGFDQGYKEGEYDGLESNNFMAKTLLTAVSSPFVVISNALNFEILGINFYRIIQLILTLLIVAFVMTKLKGRE